MAAPLLRPVLFGITLSAACTLAAGSTLPAQLSGLVQRSPFGTAAVAPSSTVAASDPLEFRAILEEEGRHYFSLFEPASKRSIWVGLNDPQDEISVKRYSPEENTVRVDYHGSPLTLSLKGAPKRFPTASMMASPSSTSSASETTNEYDDQPFRIGHVAEELEIREAVRQKKLKAPSSGGDGTLERH